MASDNYPPLDSWIPRPDDARTPKDWEDMADRAIRTIEDILAHTENNTPANNQAALNHIASKCKHYLRTIGSIS